MGKETLACMIRRREGTAAIHLFGPLTLGGILKLAEALHTARSGGAERIVLNLERVTEMDLTGFGFLRAVQVSSGTGPRCEVLIRGLPTGLPQGLDLKDADIGFVEEWRRPVEESAPNAECGMRNAELKINPQTAPCAGAPPIGLLVVDDEEQVLGYLVRYLGQAGYQVLPASSAHGALGQLETNPGRVRLALVDYRLGTQSGLKLAADMVQLQPDLRIIMMSGQETPILEEGEVPGVRRRLHKPFFGAQLLKAIREVLEE